MVIQSIDCKGNDRSTVAHRENEIRVDQIIEEKKRKLASLVSISRIDHRHCVGNFRIKSKSSHQHLSLLLDKNARGGYRNTHTYHSPILLLSSNNGRQKDSMIDTFLLPIHLLRQNQIEKEKERERVRRSIHLL